MHKLSFCRINIIEKNIAEVVVKGKVEVTALMIDELLLFIEDHMSGEISFILNKVISYTYSFDALVKFSLSDVIKNLAVVAYGDNSAAFSNYLKNNFNKSNKTIKVFNSREDAIAWMKDIAG